MGVAVIKRIVILLFISAIVTLAVTAEPWLAIAILATAIIALLIVVDGFFFVRKLYHDPIEPTAISGVMQGLPLLLLPFVGADFSSPIIFTAVAFLSGMVYAYAFNLYFKSLSEDPDAVIISIMWNLMIAMVPILAFLTIHEDLSWMQYGGIALIFIGATIASFQKAEGRKKVVLRMVGAMILLSLMDVSLKWVFNGLTTAGNSSVFWSGFLPHSAGSLVIGLAFMGKIVSNKVTGGAFFRLIKKLWWIFLIIELLQVIADALTNYAISSGQVSIVVCMSGLMGILAMGIATTGTLVTLRKSRQHVALKELEASQYEHFQMKLLGMAIITYGAYLVA